MTVSDHVARVRVWMQDRRIRLGVYAFMFLAGAGFLALALARNWDAFRAQSAHLNPWYLLLAILLYPAGMLPTVASWHLLLKSLGVSKPFRTNLRLYSLSSLPRHIPGLVLWVSSRTLLYQEQGVSAAVAMTATAAEVILMALTGFALSIPLLMWNAQAALNLPAIRWAGPLALLILLALLASAPALNRILPRLLEKRGVKNPLQFEPRRLAQALAWMVLAWVGGGAILFALAQAVRPTPLSQFPGFVGIWGAAGAVSLTIGIGIQGLGIRELTISALLSLTFPTVLAVVLAIAFRLVLTIGEILWVLIFIFLTRTPKEQEQKNGG